MKGPVAVAFTQEALSGKECVACGGFKADKTPDFLGPIDGSQLQSRWEGQPHPGSPFLTC